MRGHLISYIRVSTREQSTGRQVDAMSHLTIDKKYEEHVSGKSKERPQLRECINYAREGDTLYIYSIDRLARSLTDLKSIIDELVNKGVTVKSLKEGQTYAKGQSTSFSQMMLNILGAFAEFERNIMLERQAEGYAHARLHGTKTGKPFGKQPLDMRRRPEAIEHSNQGMTVTEIAKAMKLSRNSIYKLLSGHTKQVTY